MIAVGELEPDPARDCATAPLEVHARLVCVAGTDLGASFLLDRGTSVIGRGAVAIYLGGNAVSRHHARISYSANRFHIEDLGSRNATLVNGTAITGRVVLRYSDRVQIGDTILVFTHHDELENRVRQLQRLDAMAAAVAGMAHDFRNALQVIGSALGQLEDEVPAVAGAEPFADIRRATSAATGLAKRLVDLGRAGPVPQDAVDVAAVVAEVVAMARRVIDGQRIAIDVAVAADTLVRGARATSSSRCCSTCASTPAMRCHRAARSSSPRGPARSIAP